MECEKLKVSADAIVMPAGMRLRIAENCRKQTIQTGKEFTMKHNNPTLIRKSVVIFAAVVLCLAMSVGALAATGALEGFFEDVTNRRGAVVGTAYTPAEGEISLSAAVDGEQLDVLVTFTEASKPPYCYAETLGIGAYRIVDTGSHAVREGHSAAAEIRDGQAQFSLPADEFPGGDYRLIVSGLSTAKKADAPLAVNGSFECTFTK